MSVKSRLKAALPFWLFLFAISGCAARSNEKSSCEVRRAVYDIGSGSTKVKVADLDVCKDEIIKILLDENLPVDYAAALSKSSAETLNRSIVVQGERAIQSLMEKAAPFSPRQSVAYMTGSFRKAKNSERIRSDFERKFKIPFNIISSVSEALMGYESVRRNLKIDENDPVVVWDIGGGSMQLTTRRNGVWITDSREIASVNFKEKFIEDVQRKNPKKVYSPNPIDRVQLDAGVALASRLLKEKPVNPRIEERLAQSRTKVLGIGGVQRFSIKGQLGGKEKYTAKDLEAVLHTQAHKTDKDLNSQYAATEITNLMLVLGFMKTYQVKTVNVAKADTQEGALFWPEFW